MVLKEIGYFVTNYLGLESSMYAEVRVTLGEPGVPNGTYGGMSAADRWASPKVLGTRAILRLMTAFRRAARGKLAG